MTSTTCLPSLYKYTDCCGAKKILKNGTIKLSSPVAFNDPFDTHLGAALGLDTAKFLEELMPEFFEFSRGPLDYSILRPGPMADQIIAINKSLKNALSAKIAAMRKVVVRTPVSSIWDIAQLEQTNEETVATLRENFERYGIFCASAKKDNLLMWSHYSDHHRGVVFEISPSRKKDSAILLSRPVTYSDERPIMYRSAKQMIEQSLTMLPQDSTKIISEGLIYTKSLDWSYEAEWRFYIPNFVPKGRTSGLLKLHAEEVTAVYFGCRSVAEDRAKIIQLARQVNPTVRFYLMTMAAREYALAWEELAA